MKRMHLRLLPLAVLGVAATPALAAGPATCTGGAIAPGVYDGLNVTGTCTLASQVTINGNVTVAPGAYLDAAYLGTKLTINGNVSVADGATLGLGCSFGYHDCGVGGGWLGAVTVNGNILASNALTMYLDFTTVHGNVGVWGGGDATRVDHPPAEDGLVLVIKDNAIDGNVVVDGWKGAWSGIIRTTVNGNVRFANTVGSRVGENGVPDSAEIATNKIAGNLVCVGNTPPAQIGDSGGKVNTVGGVKAGECTAL